MSCVTIKWFNNQNGHDNIFMYEDFFSIINDNGKLLIRKPLRVLGSEELNMTNFN